jgi:hypothetical protein
MSLRKLVLVACVLLVAPTLTTAQQAPRLASIAVLLSAELEQQIADEPRFSFAVLRDAITAELRARRLLAAQGGAAGNTAEILVNEFALRATSNVVVFGRLSSVGVLGGLVRLRTEAGAQPREFKVLVEIPLSISQRKTGSDSLQKLNQRFARVIGDEIAAAVAR